ncbi:arginine repressor, partial [Virgibacillus halodenitrificans]|nr:arginine repressor [Virgibacillus halodenitrificans]MYL60755.1 arginine repressor [Virgibacillus halodenitrificans]
AQAVGALIDNLDWKEIMGTICGDDTCLIICRTEEKAEVIKERFIDML